MKRSLTLSLLATTLTLGLAAPSFAAEEEIAPSALDAAIEKYIMEHPGVIMKSLRNYHGKEKITSEQLSKIKSNTSFPTLGNPKGDVTMVEFFDYHCGYCKRFYPVVSELLEKDKKVRVIFVELPILSEDSELAARAALAVHTIDPDKYFNYHTALMKMNGKFDEEKLVSLAKQAGIEEKKFLTTLKGEEVSKQLAASRALAEELEVQSTPTVVLNNSILPGAMDLDKLRAKIAVERNEDKKS